MNFPLFAPRRAQPAAATEGAAAPRAGGAARSGAAGAAPAARPRTPGHSYAREAAALVLLTSALYYALALASFRADPMRPEVSGEDWVGPVGATLAGAGVEGVGIMAWLLPLELALLAAPLLAGRRWLDNGRGAADAGPLSATVARIGGDVVVVVVLAALCHVAFPRAVAFGAMPLGGAVGELFGELLRALFSSVGSYIIGLTVVGLILIGRATFSFIELVQRIERLGIALAARLGAWARALLGAWVAARELERREASAGQSEPLIERSSSPDAIIAALADDEAPPISDGGAPIMAAAAEPAIGWTGSAARAGSGEALPGAGADASAAAPKPRRGRRGQAAARAGAEAAPPIVGAAVTAGLGSGAAAAELDEAPLAAALGEPRLNDVPTPSPILPVRTPGASNASGAPDALDAPNAPAEPTARPRAGEGGKAGRRSPAASPAAEASPEPTRRQAALVADAEPTRRQPTIVAAAVEEALAEQEPEPEQEPEQEPDLNADPEDDDLPLPTAETPAAPLERARPANVRGPRIVDTSHALEAEKPEVVRVIPATRAGFSVPSTDMLDPPTGGRVQIDESQLKGTAQLLEKTLADYGVSGKVEEIHPGPTVTTFEVSPAAGTKVSKVAGLADDLALGLSRKVRIIAPIPGKNRIGFEVPNEHRLPVNLRELVEDRRFLEMKAPLPCVLGRDIIGTPYFADLASMPHVIVAGATGAGKSVGLNVMLVSLLFRKTPEELRLLMIDPKVVELAPFDRIPHMLLPVVTDMKQAANALKWAVDEMERRYQLFANAGTKNITTYNAWVERVRRGEARPPKGPAKVTAVAPDGSDVEVAAARDGSDAAMPEKIPFIVIVVDEFADLMMQQGKDVEASVARLAQKARAAGMHVILATQRPSVDVITGMIKANFPTRIAFRVAQKVDSRTILDEQGAEHLLGRGDMLVKMNGSNDTRRVQCPFCSEEEVQRVTDFLRSQGEPVYDEAILRPRDEDGEEEDTSDAEADPMYDAAVRIVAETRRCSTSWIQRKLGIGYNRAAKLVESMEKRGLVGPANGAKDREVLIAPI